MIPIDFHQQLAERLRAEHASLATRWFERLRELLPVDARDVFPTESLLDHIPALILDIGTYAGAPEAEAIIANTLVVEKARELGTLRHHQRASLHQLLREYQLLGGILTTFVQEEIARLPEPPSPADAVEAVARLHRAVDVLMQETVETFVRLYTGTIAAQAERLEEFTRMATHEWRQPLNSLQFAVQVLGHPGIEAERAGRTLELMQRNVAHLVAMTHTLERLARMQEPTNDPVVQDVSLTTVASQAARQLREMAETRGVTIQVAEDLPMVVVDAGRLELALVNLLSNAIKYADPAKADRFVAVSAEIVGAGECQIVVRDNGIGIPADRIGSIFDRFSRAHADRGDLPGVTGVGLGLSIVADCIRTVGGRIEVDSREGIGTSFIISIPQSPTVESAHHSLAVP